MGEDEESWRCVFHLAEFDFATSESTAFYDAGDIILYDAHLAVYRHVTDVVIYVMGNSDENELMLNSALSAFCDALQVLLRGQVERRAVLENFDLVMLCLDETIDDGCAFCLK